MTVCFALYYQKARTAFFAKQINLIPLAHFHYVCLIYYKTQSALKKYPIFRLTGG